MVESTLLHFEVNPKPNMKILSAFLFVLLSLSAFANRSSQYELKAKTINNVNPLVALSIDLLESVKNDDASLQESALKKIADIPFEKLVSSLDSKQKKLAFWVNMYNALVQIELIDNPQMFKDKKTFYKEQRHHIAGIKMSYDNIEHGILRHSRVKLSLGYIRRLFVKKWERKLRNKEIDGRIHFALNCGAISCPPVAIFKDTDVEAQLDKVNKLYLQENTIVEGKRITTTPLFSWFRADFGGKKSIKKFLVKYDILPDDKTKYDIKFKSYDWTLLTGNFIDL